ncbi:MAG: dTDP-4-dehydrorhamnose reductase [Chiayiivirga sp.]|mgnify:CR=1 FL=1|jgi:dTDP-4-dehydrorhamnose reductase|uniref:dTDP-4-dehydrorhamnose reductase n=1 Tax=Denitratimonas tolerans TaxID=1338420 RepID=A0AAW9R3J9_9GAMM|nr:dTDP-4-dehydrorhamnose reductase [Xanthomonadaceae bacterium]MDX9764804.1 dTDP-4-dehydrorhamnose reductase [Chiayiivirga sp.]HMN35403.1 dTDP-4-dehydrorhamnose reductase [Chiayiivirga sp.]HRO88145.1 dTDP-4-dehydrorhamnose reductase [Chiayiivirga sp.]HRQ35452.1 dTDP-4-dehydrorhamnose reductase [Chiayiivirga sp.]
MKLLLLGAGGQVGFELHRSLSPLGEVIPATRDGRLPGGGRARAADLASPASLEALLQAERPDVIVNAAAYTAVDRAESEPELATRINAEAPAVLARWCKVYGARLLHYSTDYVFDGSANRPWREADPTAPLGVYGQSKREGEIALADSGAEYLVLRTAWVYAARGHNFLRTMLRLAAERDHLQVVCDQTGSPTPARWIAAATALTLARTRNGNPWRSGTVHLAASGHTTWHGFAEAIFADALVAGLIERAPFVEAIPTLAWPTPARRPAYSCLDTRALRERYGVTLPDWREGVTQVVGELAR